MSVKAGVGGIGDERNSSMTIHVEKVTRGEGRSADVKYSLASEGRTYLQGGSLEEALRKLREMLEDEMD